MLDDNQIYVIVDIETDGPVPGLHSMLSIGAVASTADKQVGEFYRRIIPNPESKPDPDTMEWWKKYPEAWQEATTDAQEPEVVMREFLEWVKSLGAKPVFVAQPIEFDFTFVCWYLHRFVQENPFSDYTRAQRTLDIASFSAGKFNIPLSRARGDQIPDQFREGMPEHSHNALDDARGYGVILRNMLRA
jgi:DNA polymerase III alpha subunit (gram-positive type)